MEQYTVTGMSCAACSARVEKAVSKLDGVTSCSVSLLTNSMGVEGSASAEKIIEAVESAGYGASKKSAGKTEKSAEGGGMDEGILNDTETPLLRQRLIASLGFLIPLMYVSMGHMMWNWPVPGFLAGNHVAMGLIQLLFTTAVMIVNQKFFISGFRSLWHRAPNMDTLVALGAGASYVYSAYALFAMTDAQMHMDMERVMSYMHEFYFESAAMILTLITVGKMLEARSKGRTTDALKSLMKLAPKTAVVVRDGKEQEVAIREVRKGDIFVVRPGENIPVDGVVVEGSSAVNESALTGESIPADKEEGSQVSAATLNQSGFLRCEATRVGEDTTLSQIIQMVSDAAATKAPIAKIADRVSGVFVPAVIAIAAVTILVWLAAGQSIGFALARGISVLVISCPCALGLATPVAIMVGNGMGAKNGIMFKTAVSLEETGKIQIVALDKTGTITGGEPRVTDIIPAGEGITGQRIPDHSADSQDECRDCMTEDELLKMAYALEKKSEHPLARAILTLAQERGLDQADGGGESEGLEVTDFQAVPGNGLRGVLDGDLLTGGNLSFITGSAKVPDEMRQRADGLAKEGKTPLFFARNGRLMGVIAVADVIKEDSPGAVEELRNMGIHVVMLTGDNERTARAIGRQAGVNEVIAGVLPDGKEQVIRTLKEKGRTAMVGDGINDAPALTRADIGIAIGAGTDIAIDAADVVLMKSRLSDVPAAIRLSRATLRNIHENLFWAFFYNVIGIPLAAGVWYPLLGWKLNPMFGAAAMSLSSFCVVTNALRLNWFRMHDASRDRSLKHKAAAAGRPGGDVPAGGKAWDMAHGQKPGESRKKEKRQENKEEGKMTKTMKIEGMMCGHCEARVKKCLEALAQVDEASVSHEAGTAVLTLNADIDDEVLKKTVEDQDYQVTGIE